MPIVSYKGPPLTPEVHSSPLQWEVLLVPRPGKAHALPHAGEVPFWQGRPGLQKRLQQGGVVFLFPCDPTVLQARFDLGAALCTEIGGLVLRFLPAGPAPSRLSQSGLTN